MAFLWYFNTETPLCSGQLIQKNDQVLVPQRLGPISPSLVRRHLASVNMLFTLLFTPEDQPNWDAVVVRSTLVLLSWHM